MVKEKFVEEISKRFPICLRFRSLKTADRGHRKFLFNVKIFVQARAETFAENSNTWTKNKNIRITYDFTRETWEILSWKYSVQFGKSQAKENFKLESLELESFCERWKEPSEVWKNQPKLEITERSWKVSSKVENVSLKLKNFAAVGKFRLKLKSVTNKQMSMLHRLLTNALVPMNATS